jgi:PAS domain S-box-containing protein
VTADAPAVPAAGRLRVVLVDDADDLRTILRLALERDGRFIVVGEAADGLEGLDVVARQRPDVVVLDLVMPKLDGGQTLQRLQRESRQTCVVVLSGLDEASTGEEVRALGAADVVSKRAPLPELLERIAAAAGQQPPAARPARSHASASRRAPSPRRSAILVIVAAALLFSLGLAATISLATFWQQEAAAARAASLQSKGERLRRIMENGFTSYEDTLIAGRALFASSAEVDAAEFKTFYETLDLPDRRPGMQGLAFVARVPGGEREAFEARARRLGHDGYSLSPASPSAEHWPVLFIEPEAAFAATIGADISGREVVAEALHRARDSGRAAITEPLTLLADQDLREAERPLAVTMYVPVYAEGTVPQSVEERRRRVIGVMTAPFRIQDLLTDLLGDQVPDVAVQMSTAAGEGAPLLLAGLGDPGDGPRHTFHLDVGGQRWEMTVTALQPARLPADNAAATVLVAGLLLSLVCAGLVLGLGWKKTVAETRADTALERLQKSERELRFIADHGTDMVTRHALDGPTLYSSPAAQRLLGYAPDELPDLDQLIHPDDLQRVRDRHAELEPGEVMTVTYRLRRRDGTWLFAETTSHLVTDSPSGDPEIVATTRDITARIESQRAVAAAKQVAEERNLDLEEANTELARSNAELQQFAYVASHDLSEPLRVIAGFVDLLDGELASLGPDAPGVDLLPPITRNVGRMQALIDDLLLYSRVGSKRLERATVDLGGVLDDVQEALAVRIAESRARIEVQGSLPVVTADRTQMSQLLQNLVANALKFVADGEEPHVIITSGQTPLGWEIRVIDNGLGIAADDRDRVFDMFRRLHSRDDYEGTGIGLAVCRRIVQRHGGELWIEDRPDGGRGSTFVFTISRGHAEEPEAPVPHVHDVQSASR